MRSYRFKLLAIVLVLLMIVTSVPSAALERDKAGNLVFADMPNNWATEALVNAVNNGLLNGYIEEGKQLIKPNGVLKRSEMLTIVTRAFGAEL